MMLKDKVIIVSGVGKGMGRAMSLLFAQQGAKVVMTARTPDIIEPTKAAIEAAGGGALAISGNAADSGFMQQVAAQTVEAFSQIDGLCCVAGGYYRRMKGPDEFEEDFFDMVLQNHIKSVFHGVRAVLPTFEQQGSGSVLTFGAGYKTLRDGNIAYGTAKDAVIGLSKNLARELWPQNVRVNCICPGIVRLPLENETIGMPEQNLDRMGQPEDIAHAAAYFMSDASAWVTGQTLVIDGGDEVYAGQPHDQR
ncbi:MAG: SDR family NAD(P)-dependent oxidoreductase [Chloroflexota bacterium]